MPQVGARKVGVHSCLAGSESAVVDSMTAGTVLAAHRGTERGVGERTMNSEELKRQWAAKNEGLAQHRDLLCQFAEGVCGLMRLKPPSAASKRKPSYRLVVRGDEDHDLVVRPLGSDNEPIATP